MNHDSSPTSPSKTKVLLAFAAVYIIWGSTYLGIRLAVQSIPPFLMAGIRFLVAGSLLYAWTRLRGAPRPTLEHWKAAALIGFMLLFIGNGGLSWAEQRVPSGIAALIIAIVPLWFVGLEWFQHAIKPTAGVVAGLLFGTLGIVILIDPVKISGSDHVDLAGALVLVSSSFCWALGSLTSRKVVQPSVPLLGTSMQMLAGGVMLLFFSAITGEWMSFSFHQVTSTSLFALAYLIVFGALIGFSSYIFLLKASTPAKVSTYAYVNPVIAVLLGWLLVDEPLNARIIIAAAIIVASVALITSFNLKALAAGLLQRKPFGKPAERMAGKQ